MVNRNPFKVAVGHRPRKTVFILRFFWQSNHTNPPPCVDPPPFTDRTPHPADLLVCRSSFWEAYLGIWTKNTIFSNGFWGVRPQFCRNTTILPFSFVGGQDNTLLCVLQGEARNAGRKRVCSGPFPDRPAKSAVRRFCLEKVHLGDRLSLLLLAYGCFF